MVLWLIFCLPSILYQTPDGLIFPDRATLYITAIEDRQYKDYKIHCKYQVLSQKGSRAFWAHMGETYFPVTLLKGHHFLCFFFYCPFFFSGWAWLQRLSRIWIPSKLCISYCRVGERIWIRHVVHQRRGNQRAFGGRCWPKAVGH